MKIREKKRYEAAIARTRPKRMQWWNEARYGHIRH